MNNKNFFLGIIMCSLFLTFCSKKETTREEVLDRYPNGFKKTIFVYKVDGENKQITEKIGFYENGQMMYLEKFINGNLNRYSRVDYSIDGLMQYKYPNQLSNKTREEIIHKYSNGKKKESLIYKGIGRNEIILGKLVFNIDGQLNFSEQYEKGDLKNFTRNYFNKDGYKQYEYPNLSSPKSTLITFYQSIYAAEPDIFTRTISSDGDFGIHRDELEEVVFSKDSIFKKIGAHKIKFIAKGISHRYGDLISILVFEYYNKDLLDIVSASWDCFFENSFGNWIFLFGGQGDFEFDFFFTAFVINFVKDNNEWKVHKLWEGISVLKHKTRSGVSRGDTLYFPELKEMELLDFQFTPVIN